MMVEKYCTRDPHVGFKTAGTPEDFDFNKSTWDSHAVFDVQVGLSLRLIYLTLVCSTATVDYTS